MVQMQSYLNVADNSGAKKVNASRFGGTHRYVAGIGIHVVAVKQSLPNGCNQERPL